MEDKEIKELNKAIDDLKKRLNKEVPTPKPELKPPKTKRGLMYILGVSFLVISITTLIIMFVNNIKPFMFIIAMIILTPFLVVGLVLIGIRLFLDRHRIKHKVVTRLTKNYVVARFYLPQKRYIDRTCVMNKDQLSFDLGKQTYIVEKEKIWFNEEGHPVINYLPDLPNPIGFDIETYMLKYAKAFNEGDLKTFVDNKGNVIDLSFTSSNLHTFKRTKMFADLMERMTPEMMKIVTLLIITIMALIGLALLILIFAR